ncbi:MAG: CheR family methyltransferase [Gammaproteobacteria bacterium]
MAANIQATQEIDPQEYQAFKQFLEEACGIVLGDNKQYLVSSRLRRLMREHSIPSLTELVKMLKTGRNADLHAQIIDAMTTNETSWFRDNYPYNFLKEKFLQEHVAKGQKEVRIWSAASSSGQEAYSISMIIQEFLQKRPGSIQKTQIIGTDISPTMLEDARQASYDSLTLGRGLSAERKNNFFDQSGQQWTVKPQIRERVTFKELNLMKSYSPLGRFDIIFCRNVLIYFSAEVKLDILTRMTSVLRPGGYLILGGSESIGAISEKYEAVRFQNGMIFHLK